MLRHGNCNISLMHYITTD